MVCKSGHVDAPEAGQEIALLVNVRVPGDLGMCATLMVRRKMRRRKRRKRRKMRKRRRMKRRVNENHANRLPWEIILKYDSC